MFVFRIVFSGSFFPGEAPGVHVDGDERLGRLDDQVAAGREFAAPLEQVADLGLDVRPVEERDVPLVQLDALDELRGDALEVFDDLVEDLLGVDLDRLDLGAEDVADDAAREARLAMELRAGRGRRSSFS